MEKEKTNKIKATYMGIDTFFVVTEHNKSFFCESREELEKLFKDNNFELM
ncbi:hypothetical protein MK851_09930 [Tenacibaculum sp. 1B UA]|nr:hypothetical protein [Tenacibaculum sp. 1B UA]MDX8553937.1 hypothetical protein [Tenacibaculum sp. 1B UA]